LDLRAAALSRSDVGVPGAGVPQRRTALLVLNPHVLVRERENLRWGPRLGSDLSAMRTDSLSEWQLTLDQIELGYNEVKRVMIRREETTRSKSPRGVLQELWGLAIGYDLARYEAERVAEAAGVSPIRISFVAALPLIESALVHGAPTTSDAHTCARTSATACSPNADLTRTNARSTPR
jgi:hypothetical protein